MPPPGAGNTQRRWESVRHLGEGPSELNLRPGRKGAARWCWYFSGGWGNNAGSTGVEKTTNWIQLLPQMKKHSWGNPHRNRKKKKPKRHRCEVASPSFLLQPGALPLVLPVVRASLAWEAEVWLAASGPKHHKAEFKMEGVC